MNKKANQTSRTTTFSRGRYKRKSRSVYAKIAITTGVLSGVLMVCILEYLFLKKMPNSVDVYAGDVLANILLLIAAFAAARVWFFQTNLDRNKLKDAIKSARKLKKINGQLQNELIGSKEAQEKASIKAEKATAYNTTIRDFLASVSHEIRTPLNAMVGFAGILIDEDLTEQQSEYVDRIRCSADDLLIIINDILDFSKIEAGKMNTEMVNCSLDALFNGLESIMKPIATQKDLDFKVNIGQAVPGMIRTDPVRVRQCLINLANNALKFTKTGHVHVNVSVSEENDRRFIRFDVEDTGIGIPTDKLDKIFKSFTQADVSHTREYGGTGLGLAITKKLARILEGSLRVKSEIAKGTVFTLSIPLNIVQMPEELSAGDNCHNVEKLHGHSANEQISGRVLVAEDSRANQMLVKTLLERMGLEVVIAKDGKIALSMALAESFDLILMDIQMPNMNGYEATAAIRENGIDVPIVALTASAMKGDAEKCQQAGCDDYLAKPLDRQKLNSVICEYLAPTIIDSELYATDDAGNDHSDDDYIDKFKVNWENALRFCGDEKAIRRIVSSLLQDGPECIDEIKTAIEAKDSKLIMLFAHRLRGSAMIIGIEPLVDAAGKVEDAANDGDIALAASYVENLQCQYQRTAEFLNRNDWMEISMAASCQKVGGAKNSQSDVLKN